MINTEARPTPANRICKYHLACDMFYLFKKKKHPHKHTHKTLGLELTWADVSVFAVSLRGQHVPVALLPHPDQVPGHGQHALWSDSPSLP